MANLFPQGIGHSAETGCGKSTVLFSNISEQHTVFALDDRHLGDESSVNFYEKCPLTRLDRVRAIFGPTQLTLPRYDFSQEFDVVLIDGPHGFPFPELEYYYFYPHIRAGGVLIIDDVNIPTIGRMADIISEDEMWELVRVVASTAIFRRTGAPTFDPLGDGWWTQRYNRRRVSPSRPIHLPDGPIVDKITAMKLDVRIHGG